MTNVELFGNMQLEYVETEHRGNGMATLTIHDLPADVVERLEARARENGHSMEQEAREILGQRVGSLRAGNLAERKAEREKIFAEWDEFRKTLPPGSLPTAEEVAEWCAIARGRRRGE